MDDGATACELLSWAQQFWVLLERTFLVKARDPICLMTQISSAVLMGLIFGALYWKVYDKTSTTFTILDTQMCIVMVTLMAVWLPCASPLCSCDLSCPSSLLCEL